MKEENIYRANEIKAELEDLRYFSENINSRWKNTKIILKTKTNISYSILGNRWFGSDCHEKEIKIPKSLIPMIDAHCKEWIKMLEEELEIL